MTVVPAVRNAVDEDLAILNEMLYYALYVPQGEEPFPRSILAEPRVRAYIEGWRRPGDEGLIAVDPVGGEPIGAAWVRLFGRDNRGYGFVDENIAELSMAVVPFRRGNGVGTTILRALLERLDAGNQPVSLSVATTNPALRLYVRHGFEVIDSFEGTLTMYRTPGRKWSEWRHGE